MLFRFVFFLILAASVSAQVPPTGTWSTKDGKRFVAELIAADGLRATFAPAGKPKFVVAFKDMDPKDADAIRAWRATYFRAPLVDAAQIAPWPTQAMVERAEIKVVSEKAGEFTYESANFRLISDLKLPESAARDLATVFEATRAVLIAIPLGLHAGGEREKYTVLLKGTVEGYASMGGAPGSGGYYQARTRRMLVLLPNLGIEEQGGSLKLNYNSSLFVLKHEVTHQLLARWHGRLPMWLAEGLAEFIASLPYGQGHYALKAPGTAMRDYLLKWRKGKDDRTLELVPAGTLMEMSDRDWNKAVEQQTAYELYNSAALLTYHFTQQDGGAPLAAYLDALRQGRDDGEKLLLRGRTMAQVEESVAALAKKLGLVVKAPGG